VKAKGNGIQKLSTKASKAIARSKQRRNIRAKRKALRRRGIL